MIICDGRARPDHNTMSDTPMRVTREVIARIPTAEGVFSLALYSNNKDDKEHLAIVYGPLSALKDNSDVYVRVHSECFTGEVIGSLRCDCGEQLRTALYTIATRGKGVVIFLRQEGRGIGLKQKLKAYNIQDRGYDTVEANLMLGHEADERSYEVAARILEDLEVDNLHLLTNNPTKIDALRQYGIHVVDRVEMLPKRISHDTMRYLTTKAERMQHGISLAALRVNTVPSRPTSCPASPIHDHTYITTHPITESMQSPVHISNTSVVTHSPNTLTNGTVPYILDGVVQSYAPGLHGRPFVTLTYAQSLDGSIATADKRPLLISGPESMEMTHRLRASHDAILVGIGTVLSDDPRLTVRLVDGPDPRPVILDGHLRIPLTARILTNTVKPYIVCGAHVDKAKETALQEMGAEVIHADTLGDGRLDLQSTLAALSAKGIGSLMVEGGANIIQSFLISRLVDVCVVTISPQWVSGYQMMDRSKPVRLPSLVNTRSQHLGTDIVLVGKPHWR